MGLVNAAGALTVLVLAPLVGLAFAHDAGVAAFVVLAVLWALSRLALPPGRSHCHVRSAIAAEDDLGGERGVRRGSASSSG